MKLTDRDRRVLTWGAMIAGPVMCVGLIVRPVARSITARHDQLTQQRSLLATELGLIQAYRSGALGESGETARAVLIRRVFPARDATLLQARAIAYVTSMAELSSVQLEAASAVATKAHDGGLHELELVVRGRGNTAGAFLFVHRVESGLELGGISRLELQRSQAANGVAQIDFSFLLHVLGADTR
ncbi:MAG: hypothetical protein WEE89_07625 [Gemmatimonadota bacterium]